MFIDGFFPKNRGTFVVGRYLKDYNLLGLYWRLPCKSEKYLGVPSQMSCRRKCTPQTNYEKHCPFQQGLYRPELHDCLGEERCLSLRSHKRGCG